MISLILAHDDNLGIGLENKLPWHSPEDLAWFKKVTTGQTIVMGRKTFESFGIRKPLPNRTNVIMSRSAYGFPGCPVYSTVSDVLANHTDFIVIGGAEIYKLFLDEDLIDRMYITLHHGKYEADTFFTYPDMKNYELKEETVTAENTFRIYERS